MSFFQVADKFGVNQANLMKKLGEGDISAPGNGEVRVFKVNEKYSLKVWNGTEWIEISGDSLKVDGSAISLNKQVFKATAQGFPSSTEASGSLEIQATNEGTPAVMSFHRPGNFGLYLGLDNDNQLKMGGWSVNGSHRIWSEHNHGPASGLNADLLDNLEGRELHTGRDVTLGALTNHIQCGNFLQGHAGPAWVSQNITFSSPFTYTPRVFVQDNMLQGATVKVKGITTTGFICYIYATPNDITVIDWLAIGSNR